MFIMKNTLNMTCCVAFCKNSSDAISQSQNVTFHELPTDELCRGEWLTALGVEESQVTDTTVVCSLHFRNTDFCMTENGLRMLQKGAVPSAVQVCLICLNTDTKLYPMSKYHLEEAYTNVTGLTMPDNINFAKLLCVKCAHRLTNCNRFRDNCLKGHQLLLELVTKYELLTTQNIKTINREIFKLSPNLVTKTFEPDHCDLHMVEYNKEDKPIKQEKMCDSVKTEEVKSEINDTIEIVIEPMDIDVKCDNESDQEFLNDDIDNDAEFLNNDMNIEVEIIKHEVEDEVNDVNNSEQSTSDVQTVSAVEVVSDINVDKSVEIVQKKPVAKPKVTGGISKVRKRSKKTKMKVANFQTNDVPKLFVATALTYEEQLAEMMERKESSNYINSEYKCLLCYKGFVRQISYDRHVVKHTNIFGEHECSLCKLRFKIRHHLNDHVKSFHSRRYSCTSCSYVTKQRSSAKLHSRWHEGIKYECPQCFEEFSRYTSYMSHLRVKHPSDFVCGLCGFSFVSKKGLQQHCTIKHRFDDVQNTEGPLCEPCNVRFASEAAYNKHMEVSPKHAPEGARVRNDQHTEYKFSRKSKRPDDTVVGDMEYVTCELCGFRLKNFKSYTFHYRRVHMVKTQEEYDKDPMRCLCEQCGKGFKNPTVLRYHMAEHSGVKPYKCDTCPKRFAAKGQLTLHLKVHRPSEFECGVCGKHFSYKSNRDRHLWIHKNEYFKCNFCEKSFGSPDERRSHTAHVHLKKPWPKRKRDPEAQGGRGGQGKKIKTAEDECDTWASTKVLR